jgi:hypothetical protein
VTVCIDGPIPAGAYISVTVPERWRAEPARFLTDPLQARYPLTLHPPVALDDWRMLNLFQVRIDPSGPGLPGACSFGVAGAGLWRFLGVYYDALPDAGNPTQQRRSFNQHFVSLDRPYLARTLISPAEREAYFVIGNNDAYRLYLNGVCVSEMDEMVWWSPFNNVCKVTLYKGQNQLLLKLLKRGDELKFTFGVRQCTGHPGGFNCEDWMVDLVDSVIG